MTAFLTGVWTWLGGLVPIAFGAFLTFLATLFADRRLERRLKSEHAAADLIQRFEAGKPDAVKALKLAMRLLNQAYPEKPVGTEPIPPPPLTMEADTMKKLQYRVMMIPDSTFSERTTWLLRAAENPSAYAPEPALTHFPFFQVKVLAYVADDLSRFIRRDPSVDKDADDLSKAISTRFFKR